MCSKQVERVRALYLCGWSALSSTDLPSHAPPLVMARAVSDDELLRRARNDAEAFGVFFDRHSLRVYRFLLRATGDHASATELTSETFAQALLGLARFRGRTEGAGVAWLFGIARRVLLRSLRTQRREATARRRLGVPTGLDGWDEAESDSRLDGARLSLALADATRAAPRSRPRRSGFE